MLENIENTSDFLFYSGHDGSIRAEVIVDPQNETVWATQNSLASIFDTSKQNISYHISNVLKDGELSSDSTVKEILTVQKEGEREVNRTVQFYNLDMVIAVGYRVNSYNATQFRVWATKILKEYLVKGFVLDDERLKQGKAFFGKDYFNELLERIREIRASERRFYQKITDIYAQCSIDYDAKSPITQKFYATVQNKLEYAITHKTAAEIVKTRANALLPHMGLKTWKNMNKGGKIMKSDVTVAKNYLHENEISELNKVVTMYLDYAELQAERQKAMKMSDWIVKLDAFLQFNEYDILNDAGKMRKDIADAFAEGEYIKFRPIQDMEFISDFDKVVKSVKSTGKLPKEKKVESPIKEPLSDMNKKLKKALEFDPNKDKQKKISRAKKDKNL